MLDGFGRTVDYLRISVTDRCNLRCVYCMPEEGAAWTPHERILRYEDILRLCGIFASLGVRNFRITGGEPLIRKGLPALAAGIKAIPGAERVALTTNGVMLAEALPALLDAGIDGINFSLDTLDRERFAALTRRDMLPQALRGLDAVLKAPGLTLKLNCVAASGSERDWLALAAIAREHPVAVRFIEAMPIGLGRTLEFCGEAAVRKALEKAYGEAAPCAAPLGSGPARYVSFPGFAGSVGFISALSHRFCGGCNRVRLTAAGFLKTCLQYDAGVDLAPLLGDGDETLREAIRDAILRKPEAHQFQNAAVPHSEGRIMSQIGG
ncbi:MAG: GTP 3',8-cyclase MoaA [Oscillospiraceae bacterium]|nr:GTP 3',8-cyclase MoaA [Oscillospiraceae bacterium]